MSISKEEYGSFKNIVGHVINTAYEAKLSKIRDKAIDFMKKKGTQNNTSYAYLYLNNHGYYFPSKFINIDRGGKEGLCFHSGKYAYALTPEENEELYNMIASADNEIKFLKQFYAMLSNKYDSENKQFGWCVAYLPKILVNKLQLSSLIPDKVKPIEKCDEKNYQKFCDLLKVNAVSSLLLGE